MCGVAGVALSEDAAPTLYCALYAIQHRGQESAGIATASGNEVLLHKMMGLVPEVFGEGILRKLKGNVGIGHVRYSTTGPSRIENAQPFVISYREGGVAICHNGDLVNYLQLREELEREGRVFLSDSDTEVIAHLLVKELMHHDLPDAMREVMRRLNGAYSMTLLVNGKLVAVRDPLGVRPLCIGKLDSGYIVASESVAIDAVGGRFLRDVRPGEVVIFDDGMESYQIYRPSYTAHCVFEYIYFARPDSMLDGRLVYDARREIGRCLAREHGVDADIVSPVPDSGTTFAIGYAAESGIPYGEAFMKNRYVGRTFIMPGQRMRDFSVKLKLNVISSNVFGKRVVIVDDSIVRGTTSKRIVSSLRERGAREVHVRIGSPPIKSPCYLGIDIKRREELIAARRSVAEIRKFIGADSLGYLSLEGLIRSVGKEEKNLCLGCLTGVYPVEIPGERCVRRQLTLAQF